MNRIPIGPATFFLSLLSGCNGQDRTGSQGSTSQIPTVQAGRVGGPCEEGYCELMYLGMPKEIDAVDTSAGWYEAGQKLIVTGTVMELDGKTPAPNVILYYHHSDNNGYYSPGDGKLENRTRHGHIRGWVKTDEQGNYTLYTIRPAPYPDTDIPAHIHWFVKEPDIANEYFIEDITFEDDPLLVAYRRRYPDGNLGGSGTVSTTMKDGIQMVRHKVILGKNFEIYPR